MSFWDGTKWIPDRPARPVATAPRHRIRDWVATVVMLAGLVIIIFPGNPSSAAGPKLSATPTAARAGDVLRVSGSGFPIRSTVQLAWDGSVSLMPSLRVSGNGTFKTRMVVAVSTPGVHTITAIGDAAVLAAEGAIGLSTSQPMASVSVTVLVSEGGETPTANVTATPLPSSETSASQAGVPTGPPTTQPTAAPTAQPTAAPTAPPTAAPTAQPTAAPPPPLPPPPPAGLPTINPSYGTLLRKVFTDGTMGPFRVLTYPDAHIGGARQYTTVYNRFSNGARQASVHDGYLDLRATRRTDGLWDAVLVGTSQDGNGRTFGYGVYRFWLSFNIAPQTWQAAWLYDTTTWSATEIDFPEMLENMSLAANVLGSGAGGKYGLPRPANLATAFHEFKIERRATFVAFSMDGVEVARVAGAMPATQLAILFDSKVGHPWMGAAGAPSGSTPSPTYLRVAAITVDP